MTPLTKVRKKNLQSTISMAPSTQVTKTETANILSVFRRQTLLPYIRITFQNKKKKKKRNNP